MSESRKPHTADVATAVTRVEEPSRPAPPPQPVTVQEEPVVYDPRKRIHVYDKRTGKKHPGTVPETYLREFPHLAKTPTQRLKEGK